jgi:hypothetical protein
MICAKLHDSRGRCNGAIQRESKAWAFVLAPTDGVTRKSSRAIDNRPVSCHAAKRWLTPQGDEICLAPMKLAIPWSLFQTPKTDELDQPAFIRGDHRNRRCFPSGVGNALRINAIPLTANDGAWFSGSRENGNAVEC